ncbi:MAG: Mur ligase family protein [Lysobacterales bacterium]
MLETVGIAVDDALIAGWRARVGRMRAALGWPDGAAVERRHAGGASLALSAPIDQLLAATEVNEWALLASLWSGDDGTHADIGWPQAPGHAAAWDEAAALRTLRAFAAGERDPALVALVRAAEGHGVDVLLDDEELTLGSGRRARTIPLAELPNAAALDWAALGNVPIALVTGSNGKTTTTRVLAAILRASGLRVVHTCTDGVCIGAEQVATGDYSGPAGARLALRRPDIDAAVLETARGGILRRGLAVPRADVAVVTNVSDDHFGEYGIDNLDDLAAVKLTVARALDANGTLVLNADDALLARCHRDGRIPPGSGSRLPRLAWFSADADVPLLATARDGGSATCGVRAGRLVLEHGEHADDLGAIDAMPLTFGGAAHYNVANLAAAALAAHALGIGVDVLRSVLTSFGAARADNPGRLEHYAFAGIEVFVDYAHNPDGLRGLLRLVLRDGARRFGLLLGQAGNRDDTEIRELAAAAAEFAPARIVLKDIQGYLRGRAEGEIPSILRAELVRRGVEGSRIATELDEFAAVRHLLGWARPGDTLVLPVHGKANRPRVAGLLERLAASGWQAGSALPPDAVEAPCAAEAVLPR